MDFFTNMHNFLCNLTDLRYKMMGLSVLYNPLEGKDLSVMEASSDTDLTKRLETVLTYWMRQIKIALDDKEQTASTELLCLNDEYEFWTYRC